MLIFQIHFVFCYSRRRTLVDLSLIFHELYVYGYIQREYSHMRIIYECPGRDWHGRGIRGNLLLSAKTCMLLHIKYYTLRRIKVRKAS